MKLTAVGDPEVDAELDRRVAAALTPAVVEVESIPEPLVGARPASAEELARANSARLALKNAQAAGWLATVTYSRGPYLGAKNDVLEHPVECVALRAARDCDRIVATWVCRPSKIAPHKKTGVMTEKWELDCAYARVDEVWKAIGGNDIKKHLEAP